MITLVHFNLRDSIMVGKKKTQDVQARHLAPVSHFRWPLHLEPLKTRRCSRMHTRENNEACGSSH